MLPEAVSGDGCFEFGSGELTETISLVLDCHRKDLGMFNEIAFGNRRWRGVVLVGYHIGEVASVAEEIEVLNHEFDDLRIVASIRGIGTILCRSKLDNSGLSFLALVSDDLTMKKI